MSKSEYSADKALELAKYINNIKELRGLGLNQLALLANMDSAALHKILHGTVKKVNPFHLQAIAKVLRIDYRILYQIVEYLDTEEEIKNIENLGIPIYSSISYADSIVFGNILEYINISSLNNDSFFGLAIYDDSMSPTVQKNSSVIIEKITKLQDKDIGLFHYMGNTILRKIWLTENETVLVSENTDYPPIVIKDLSAFSILGKVRHILHKL